MSMTYDVFVVGGGPFGRHGRRGSGARGRKVALLDRAGRIKPCGGAIPPRLIADFDIPDEQIVARITHRAHDLAHRPRGRYPIENGFVGMVDREHFDEFLRARAAGTGPSG
jgi:geranylgeranyl diphosphate/geranylgeranyl-bacteriochlorophyllide a reductase